MQTGISACIICKDEEKNLNRCLKSIYGIVDEIIFLDTGSTDNSIEIAKSYNSRIYRSIFENDFSKARNECLSYAKYEWIIIMDCDEELSQGSISELRNILKEKMAEGIIVNIINMINGLPNDKFQFSRIFKNRKDYYFKGKIHEQVAPSIVKNSGLNSLIAKNIDILHYGYDYDFITELKKHKRNLEILESIDEKNRNDYYYFNLGNEFARINDYKKAISNYEFALNLVKSKDAYTIFLYERLSHFYYLTQKYQKCINCSNEGINLFNTHMYFYYIKGLAYIEQMKFTNALETLINAKTLLETNLKNKDFIPIGLGIYNQDKMYEAIKELQTCIIGKCKKGLTTIIDSMDTTHISCESIKSINEISNKIIVITSENTPNDFNDILDYEVINFNHKISYKEVFENIKNKINTKYILLLKNKEGLTFEAEVQVIKETLKDVDYIYFKNLKENTHEIRLVTKDYLDRLGMLCNNNLSMIDISYF